MSSRHYGLCLVCGHTAVGINFSVPTCAPCKTFFRRNALKLGIVDFVCPRGGDCPVAYKSHRICKCCRLAKCFRVGMDKSLIRTEKENQARKEDVQQNRQKRAQIRPTNLLCSTYSQSRCLSSSDQTLLTNISSAYERTCIAIRNNHYQCFPAQAHSAAHTLLNEYKDRHISLIEYCKLIPEFKRISIDDRIRLIRNQFIAMSILHESINQSSKNDTLALAIKNVYGTEICTHLFRCFDLIQAYEHDPILVKLILIIQSLSSGISRNYFDTDMDHIYDDTKTIFASQNVYVELLWRYILTRLPSERHAVRVFNKITLDLAFMLRVIFMLDGFVYNFPDEIDQMEPLMKCMFPRSDIGNMNY